MIIYLHIAPTHLLVPTVHVTNAIEYLTLKEQGMI